ncbi:NAD(P)/FAD-dependent oxidoreductase [Brevibacillus dissolubilis]|uniref:NAD(P)/FAD-dependent oxidoreductase n=1 Tax=Brevibacillus dissolubilis TaxID=1844116 RepID=UPI001116069B|nr:NAD(P)/FAD-dependent oxidoreductase [Brevibacillus dissolubilis]
MNKIETDVLILGGGPAGLATAIKLAELGIRSRIIGRQMPKRERIGESLSPSSVPLLKQLGLWETFKKDNHNKCYGNKSSWGSPDLHYHDFIQDPNGHAWHINRQLFEQRMQERATSLGVVVEHTAETVSPVWHDDQKWQLTLGDRGITARFTVDATGRPGWFARKQNQKRVVEDRQIGIIAFLQKTTDLTPVDSTSLIEAVETGWWYTAPLPNQRLVTVFMTDPDLHDTKALLARYEWQALLEQTRYTRERVGYGGYQLISDPYAVAIDSSHLESCHGANWLATGDAAMAYDPVSSHGITLALAGGRDAAQAIVGYLSGDTSALAAYSEKLLGAYEYYSEARRRIYQMERRWGESLYWMKRQ